MRRLLLTGLERDAWLMRTGKSKGVIGRYIDVVAAAEGARAAEEAVKRARPGSADVAWRPDRAPDCFNSDASVALRVSSGMRGDDPQARTLLNNMMDATIQLPIALGRHRRPKRFCPRTNPSVCRVIAR